MHHNSTQGVRTLRQKNALRTPRGALAKIQGENTSRNSAKGWHHPLNQPAGWGQQMGTVDRTPSQEIEEHHIVPEDPDASEHAKALKRVCTSAWKFHEQVTKHIVGEKSVTISYPL